MTMLHQNVFVYKGGTQKVPKNIVSASIDPSVRIIPSMAFKGCKLLTQVSFSKGLQEIKSFAFSDCISLQEIRLPKTTEIVGCGAFANCIAARHVYLNEGLTELSTSSFKGCSMVQHLGLPSTLNLLGKWAFAECKQLKEVAIHHGRLAKIEDSAFEGCDKLEVIGIPSSISVIGHRAIPETAIQERENAGIVWQQVYHSMHDVENQGAEGVLPVTVSPPANSHPSHYDLTLAKRDIQGLNTDILEILDANQNLQAQTVILLEGQAVLTSELNAMKRQNVEARNELMETVQERDALKQEVAIMKECLHVLKSGFELLAQKEQGQPNESMPQMIVEEDGSDVESQGRKKRSRSVSFEDPTKESSTVGGRVKRLFRGILWSSSSSDPIV